MSDMKMMTARQVRERLGISKTGLHDAVRRGDFPKPVKFGPRTVRFVESEVEDYIAARLRERDAA